MMYGCGTALLTCGVGGCLVCSEIKKKTLVFIVLLALSLNCAYTPRHYLDYQRAQPIVISKLVGETIDVSEREQYGLFKGIEDFESASFYKILNGGYEVIIITTNNKYVAVNRDSLAVEILGDYISRYEEIKNSKTEFEEKWKIVDYDELGQPITKYEINRVKKSDYTIGCTSTCCLLGLVPLTVLAVGADIASESGSDVDIKWFFLVIGGSTAGVVAGFLEGNRADKHNALEVIKKVRQPRIVDNF